MFTFVYAGSKPKQQIADIGLPIKLSNSQTLGEMKFNENVMESFENPQLIWITSSHLWT